MSGQLGHSETGLLLVLSHMRSYSTLLTHLLANNPEICGWRELHRSYKSPRQVEAAIAAIVEEVAKDEVGRCRLACDNLLHNDYVVGDEVFAMDSITWIISVRNPRPTIRSLWRWGGPNNIYRRPGAALDYYRRRLNWLAESAQALEGRFTLLRSDRLVKATDEALGRLTDSLALDVPLKSTYVPAEEAGTAGYGDFSRFIRSGRILPHRHHRVDPEVPEADLDAALVAHTEFHSVVKPLASVVV